MQKPRKSDCTSDHIRVICFHYKFKMFPEMWNSFALFDGIHFMCNKVCNCQFSMTSDDRNCGSSWRRFGQVSHQAGPSGSLHCLAARHSVTAMASSILAVSKYRNMFFKYTFFQYCFVLCAYASHVLSIDRAEKELEGFSCRLNPFHCGIGYCGIVALVIVQTESIPLWYWVLWYCGIG